MSDGLEAAFPTDSKAAVVAEFHRRYYDAPGTWRKTYWLGVRTQKCPLDLWIYQEVLYGTRPDLIIETGTAAGGSALYLASMCNAIGAGRVLTIDVEPVEGRPVHPRITYLTGSSVDPGIESAVRAAIRPGERVMVILDSDHSREHVLAELRAYGRLVTEGNYLVVEDTNLTGHPVPPNFPPGPMEAVEEFLAEDDSFEVDRDCEKFFLTFNPSGYLRRVKERRS